MPTNLDELTARAVAFIELVSRRAVTAATVVLATVAATVTATTVLGMLVFSGPARVMFLTLAVSFGALAIGAAWLGRWRLGVAGRKLPELSKELRQLISSNPDGGSSVDAFLHAAAADENIVDAYVVGADDGEVIVADTNPAAVAAGTTGPKADSSGRRFGVNNARALIGLRSLAGEGINKFGAIASVVGGARTYPLLAFWSLVITAGFAIVGSLLFLAYVITLAT